MTENNVCLNDKYKLIKEIGSGSFGKVYFAVDRATKHNYAVKLEDKTSKARLLDEYNIYKKLEKNGLKLGIPKIVEFLEMPKTNCMVMQLLGESLDDIFVENDNIFDTGTVLKLGVEIVNLLSYVHMVGFIHRDIKPNNFMIGKNNRNELYIMDFGLSKQYVTNDKHIEMRLEKDLVGTARYASINVHMGIEPSRRDDLESVGYMLIYFIKGRLPWQGLKKKNKNDDQITLIGNTKMMTHVKKLCQDIPDCFMEYLQYCKNLHFNDTPNYNYLKALFVDAGKKMKIPLRYCWT